MVAILRIIEARVYFFVDKESIEEEFSEFCSWRVQKLQFKKIKKLFINAINKSFDIEQHQLLLLNIVKYWEKKYLEKIVEISDIYAILYFAKFLKRIIN